MKRTSLIIIIAFCLLKSMASGKSDSSEFTLSNFGIGKLKIEFLMTIAKNEDYIIDFYDKIGDEYPRQTLKLKWNNNGSGFVEIFGGDFIKINDFFIEEPYYIIHFNCFKQANGFFEVVVNEETNQKMWIKGNQTTEFLTWSDYILNAVSLNQLDLSKNPVRLKPNDSSKIVYDKYMDWEPVSIKGFWVEVKYSEILMDTSNEENPKISGWIKWRDKSGLLVEYGLAL